MSKFVIGDIVIITRSGLTEGTVLQIEKWRGGGVAPYLCKVLSSPTYFYKVGQTTYMPGRDMELKEMQGKKKVWCCHTSCTIYSFEDKGVLTWECYRHCSNNTNCIEEKSMNRRLSTEEKLNLLLEYLGLDIETEPKVIKLAEKTQKPTE